MAPAVDSPPQQAAGPPDAGVIRDARIRRRQRRRAAVIALIATALLGGLVGGGLAGLQSGSSPRAEAQRRLAFERERYRRLRTPPHVSPALEGGEYGWALSEPDGSGCCTLPSRIGVGVLAGWRVTRTEEVASALLASRVKSILSGGTHARVTALASLPYGLRFAHVAFPRHARHLLGEGAPPLIALGSDGRPVGYLTESSPAQARARWWQKPGQPPPGPCQLRAHGLAGLKPEWGHVAPSIRPYPQSIIGRAFFSCVDTEYYVHNWPLETAILLDAGHPGRPPAQIPGMHAIAESTNVVEAPGDWHGQITATRTGDAWLVVAGGNGPKQRLEVLRHLTPTISLPRT
jgi:hypothetical protein